ncbi:hypothetical protein YC2023_053625 [Brassica napus]
MFGVKKDQKLVLPKIIESFSTYSCLSQATLMEMIQECLPETMKKRIKKLNSGRSRKSIVEWMPHSFVPDADVTRYIRHKWKDEYGKNEDEVQIYETEIESWRIVHVSPLDWKVDSFRPRLSDKGKMYWIAQSKDDLGPMFIQSSDFLNETFTSVWPLLLGYNPLHTNAHSVYNHNILSLIHQRHNTNVIDVWVANPLAEEAVAWNHVFTVANEGLPYLHRYYDIGYLVHFLDKKNTLVVMCMEHIGEKNEDSDDENDEGIPQIRL